MSGLLWTKAECSGYMNTREVCNNNLKKKKKKEKEKEKVTHKLESCLSMQGTEKTEETLNIFLEYVPGGSIASLLAKFGEPI